MLSLRSEVFMLISLAYELNEAYSLRSANLFYELTGSNCNQEEKVINFNTVYSLVDTRSALRFKALF